MKDIEQIIYEAIPDDLFQKPYSKNERRAKAIAALTARDAEREASIIENENVKNLAHIQNGMNVEQLKGVFERRLEAIKRKDGKVMSEYGKLILVYVVGSFSLGVLMGAVIASVVLR